MIDFEDDIARFQAGLGRGGIRRDLRDDRPFHPAGDVELLAGAGIDYVDISLPPLAIPAGAYVPFVRTGDLVFISGHIAKRDGKPGVGKLGHDIDTATGKLAARAVAIDLLGTLHAAIGDLEKVVRIVKVMSLVNSTPDFTADPTRKAANSKAISL